MSVQQKLKPAGIRRSTKMSCRRRINRWSTLVIHTESTERHRKSITWDIARRSKVVIVFDSEQIMQRKQWWNPETLHLLLPWAESPTMSRSRRAAAVGTANTTQLYSVDISMPGLRMRLKIDTKWKNHIASAISHWRRTRQVCWQHCENQLHTLTDANGHPVQLAHDKWMLWHSFWRRRYDYHEHTPCESRSIPKCWRNTQQGWAVMRNAGTT